MNYVYVNLCYIFAPFPSNTDATCFLRYSNHTSLNGISCLCILQCHWPHQENTYVYFILVVPSFAYTNLKTVSKNYI